MQIIKRLLMPFYIVSGASFLIAIIRDFIFVQNFTEYNFFFQMLYICSICSIFHQTIITIDTQPNIRQLTFQIFLSILIIPLISPLELLTIKNFITISLIMIIWALGFLIMRILLINKNFYLSRSRDLINSIIIIMLVYFLQDINLILVLSYLITLLITWMIIDKNKKEIYFQKKGKLKIFNLIKINIFSSLAIIIFNYWALHETSSGKIIFGYDKSLLIRLSFYFFATLQIGSILIKFLTIKKFYSYVLLYLSIICFCIYFLFLPKNFDVLIFPVSCAFMHISLLILTNTNKKPLYRF